MDVLSFQISLLLKLFLQDFPGGPVVKTPRFHCRVGSFDPWSGKFRMRHGAGEKKKLYYIKVNSQF